jgi:branched-chain amino acid transport system permease protein
VFLVGVVVGYLIWPLRVDTYSKFWMPLYGGFLALFIRGIYKQARGGGHGAPPAGHGVPPVPSATATSTPTPAEVG